MSLVSILLTTNAPLYQGRLLGIPVEPKMTVQMHFPDQKTMEVNSWCDILTSQTQKLMQNYNPVVSLSLPLKFQKHWVEIHWFLCYEGVKFLIEELWYNVRNLNLENTLWFVSLRETTERFWKEFRNYEKNSTHYHPRLAVIPYSLNFSGALS